ncbi:prepilin peptidase [Candidatus Woesearchaeota archaeon]|nr:prepilin peptidase [Candidatus Woesearchaeota archaeon]
MTFALLSSAWGIAQPIMLLMVTTSSIALLIASIADLKSREVPDWLNYALLITAFGYRLLYAVHTGSWIVLWEGILGFLIFLGIAYLMFYTGQWGGGDSKMLMALGMMIGFHYTSLYSTEYFLGGFSLGGIPLLFRFFVILLFSGAIWGICWSAYLTIKHRQRFKQEYFLFIRKKKVRLLQIASRIVFILFLPMILVSSLSLSDKIILFVLFVITIITLELLFILKAVERACMYKQLEPSKLTEGDWIAEPVIVEGKVITGPKDLGISKEQIQLLQQLKAKGKIDTVLVKEGIPFIPSFLIGFILFLLSFAYI